MLLPEQLSLLRTFGLTFHESLTQELLLDATQLEWWHFSDPPFKMLLERLHPLDYDYTQKHGVRLTPLTTTLDLESYDGPTTYSRTAKLIADMSGSLKQLKNIDEEMIVGKGRKAREGKGWIEYSFEDQDYRHEHPYLGDWIYGTTVIEMAVNLSAVEDGYQFYVRCDGQTISLFYMLQSKEQEIRDALELEPIAQYLQRLAGEDRAGETA